MVVIINILIKDLIDTCFNNEDIIIDTKSYGNILL